MICLRPNRYLILLVVTVLALLAMFATLLFGASTASAQGGAPEAPDKPTGTADFRGGVDLEWNKVTGAESYAVQLYRNGKWIDLPGDGVEIAFYGAGAIISGLNHSGFSYYFQVRANNAHGASDWSEYLMMQSTSEYPLADRDRPGNIPATGAPAISGTAHVGETLTADTSGIADENGLDRVKFYYQWTSGEGAAQENIAGATGSSYTLTDTEGGKAVRVRVSFTDRGGYTESPSSAATEVATPTPPPPTPTPTPDPTAGICDRTQQVQDAILAELPEVSDCSAVTADDLRSIEGELRLNGTEIAALRARDFHGFFNLKRLFLNFNDLSALPDGLFNDLSALVRLNLYGNDLSALPDGVFEGLYNLSDSHLSGNPAAPFTLTAELEQQADYAFLVKVAEGTPFDMDVTLSFRGAVQSGATVTVEGGSVRSLPISVTPSDAGQPRVTVSVESAIFSKYNRSYATGVETGLGDDLILPGESENTPATGAPVISGTALVGETLTADTSAIADDDGLQNATFSYQWLSSRDTEIQGATGATYTLVAADEGKIIKVRVSFTDDAGNAESLTSAATGAVEAATPQGICDRTRQVQDAILAWLPDVSDCSAVTDDDLKSIWGELRLNGTEIAALQAVDFHGLSSLRWLYLEKNDLSELPDGVFDGLSSLADLRLYGNELSELPDGVFDNLSSLEELSLNGNNLSALPEGVFDHLSNLEVLDLDHNRLSALPDGVFDHLSNLEVLILHDNYLSALPDGVFDDLSSLKELWLHRNDLSDLPDGVFDDLSSLEELDLYDNDLSELPDGVFDDLSSLGRLDLSYNDLSDLPDGVFEGLSSLYTLALSGNPGAPFTITAELERQADYAFVVKIAEGAPFDMDVTLSFRGAVQSGANVTVEGGSVRSQPVSVTPSGAGQPRVTVSVESAVFRNYDSSYTTGVETGLDDDLILPGESANTPATGAPTVTGTAQVGETLTADTSAIADQDGLQNATFSYQWLSSRDTEIQGATGSTYTLVGADEGKIIKVRVSFTDDAGNAETLTSVATAAVEPKANSPATGDPTISGTAQVGETLTADTSGIADADGLSGASFSYQWLSSRDTEIQGATGSTYTLVGTDEGKIIKVRVSFTDDAGNAETLTSVATGAVAAATAQGICDRTQQVQDAILAKLPDVSDCSAVTDNDLRSVTGTIRIRNQSLPLLQPGDFDGLSSLEWLLLDLNNLSELPDGVFDGLSNLERLSLYYNNLSELPDGVFDDLSNLEWLLLYNNNLSELPDGVFEGLSNLERLYLNSNDLSTLPDGVFEGLYNLNVLGLSFNPEAPFTITAELEQQANYAFVVKIAEGAPFDMEVTLSFQGATQEGAIVTVEGGSVRSLPISVTPSDAGQPRVTVSVESAFFQNYSSYFTDGISYPNYTSGVETGLGDDLILPGESENTPATGAPTISGTAQVGETLTADTSAIADQDGLQNATFSYQWLSSRDTEIQGATGSTYTLVGADEGKIIKVRVSFTDDAGNAETLTSVATAAVEPKANSPATGDPTISGTAQVGETLTADTSGIADADGLSGASFSYQWLSSRDTEIQGATGSTYTLVGTDEGKIIKVRVSFTDDAGNAETLTSVATGAVAAATAQGICDRTQQVQDAILAKLPDVSDCSAVTDNDLRSVTGTIRIRNQSLPLLQPGDFDGLSSLEWLLLDLNNLSELPDGVFDGLSNLERLSLYYNNLSELPDGVFDDLSNLEWLLLYNNNLSELPDGVFEGLSNLERLYLNSNDLSTLPDGVFEGLYNLNVLGLSFNPEAPFTITAELEQQANYAFVVKIAEGAPFDMEVTLSFQGATQEGAIVTVEGGSVRSLPISVTPSDAGQPRVTVSVESAFFQNYSSYFTDGISYPNYTSGVETGLGDDLILPGESENTPATGAPTISGTAQVGETLTADTSAIADQDGLQNATFSYQWLSSRDTEIQGATGSTYTLVGADEGKIIKVRVSFTDDAGNAETLTSVATAAVEPKANSPATGDPTISGTAQVGETLTADTSGIADADGLSGASFSYQWLSSRDTEIQGATGSTYTLVGTDEGKIIKVRVSFTDDAGNAETLTSVATGAVAAATAQGICDRTQQVQDAILAKLPDVSDCSAVTDNDLRSVTGTIRIRNQSLPLLQPGDFDGLSSLEWLLLDLNNLSELPDGVFDGLSNLERLSLYYNNLSELPDGVFDDLSNLEWLLLYNNNLSELPDGVFEGLSNLERLYLNSNDLSTLPDGVFEGLYNLNVLGLSFNPEAPFTITAELEQQANYAFVVKIAEGAPFDMEVTLSFQGATQEGAIVTVEGGSVRSLPISVTPSDAGQPRVTVSVESAFFQNYSSYFTDGISYPNYTSGVETGLGDDLILPGESENTPATGAPTISGTAQVGETLTADTSGIADQDGLQNVTFSYQWLSSRDTEIQGATGSTYTPVAADGGKTVKVRVSFTDDAGNAEILTSTATEAVEAEESQEPPPAPQNLTAVVNGDGSVSLSWEAPDNDSVTGYQILRRRPAAGEKTLLVYVEDTGSTATTHTDTDVTAGTQHVYRVKAINSAGLSGWSNYVNVTPAQPEPEPDQNTAATGAPGISGMAQVGETLTADTSGIADADGLTGVTFSYQWLGSRDTEIQGATDSSYTLADADAGKTIKVRVSFTDDAGNEETLTSTATASVKAAPTPNSPATGAPSITGTAQVGETLTADTSGIADEDGLDNATFSYQWLADGAAISGATGSTYTLADADESKAVTVRVSFSDDAGNGETLTSAATIAIEAAVAEEEPTEPPPAPTNLTATVNADGLVTLTWDAPDDDSVTGYLILRRRPYEGEKTLLVYVENTGSTATTFTDTDVTAGTQHVYRVQAINGAGVGGQSNYVNVDP